MAYRPEIDGPRAKAAYWRDPQKFKDRKRNAREALLTEEQKAKRDVRRAKHAEYMRKYYAEHPGYKSAADKKHRRKYLEKIRARERYLYITMSPERKAAYLADQKRRHAERQDELKAYAKQYYQKTKEKRKVADRIRKERLKKDGTWQLLTRGYGMKHRHGLTLEQYDAMLAAQGGVCAICGEPPTHGINKKLHVDHNHKTEVRRGLLCMKCNHAIERLETHPDWHEKALAYLQRPR
jgi:hypothetical protein